MSEQADIEFAEWKNFHGAQLKAIGLPESLHRILFAKLKFEDYDFSNFCKIVIEEDSELVNVVCTKEIKANAEVFMVDHAWTFKYEDALATLKENSKLVDRLWSLTEYCCDKLDLPDHEEKPEVKEPIEDVIARLDAEESVIYDLDDYGINSLKELPNKGVFPDRTEQLSLMDNGIINPNEIANNLVNLPNLKGLWMNRCPVVDACANFDSISELMPSCQIMNSKCTAKASDWAILWFANANGADAKTLEEITRLDLSGRGVIFMPTAEPFSRMKNLKYLDLSDNPEFFRTEEKEEQLQFAAMMGIDKEQKQKVEFTKWQITFEKILEQFGADSVLEELDCDAEMELHILVQHAQNNMVCPSLKIVNGVSLDMLKPDERGHSNKLTQLLNKLSKVAGHYSIATPTGPQSVWYITDEVGSAIQHSDAPNLKAMTFINSPNNKLGDPHMQGYNVLWPVQDMVADQVFYRDFLNGFTEAQFRSTRLHTWFDVPEIYFKNMLKTHREIQAPIRFEQIKEQQQELQANAAPKTACDENPLKIYTEDKALLAGITDPRFQFVDTPAEAQVFWLYSSQGAEKTELLAKAAEQKAFVNMFPNDACLLQREALADLVQSTYGSCVPYVAESFVTAAVLPAFLGRTQELENNGEKKATWVVSGGAYYEPSASGVLPLASQNVEWVLRMSETPEVKVIQRMCTPLLHPVRNTKLEFKVGVFLKSLMPLQAYVSENICVLEAEDAWNPTESHLFNKKVHLASNNTGHEIKIEEMYELDGELFPKVSEAINACLLAYQVKTAKSEPDEKLCRAIYVCNFVIDRNTMLPEIQGFSFGHDESIDLNQAFSSLFFDDQDKVRAIN